MAAFLVTRMADELRVTLGMELAFAQMKMASSKLSRMAK
jgi:hypothetical protein